MKYNIGDKVKVKSLKWYNENKNEFGKIDCSNTVFFASDMSKFCGSILTIKNIDVDIDAYEVEENNYLWTDDMFEGLVKEEGIYDEEFANAINTAYNACLDDYNEVPDKIKISQIFISNKNYQDKVELCLGNDYEIVVEDGRTFVQKKKPKYPTNHEECCQYLGCNDKLSANKLVLFSQLINARNAYWKIAGEEMGLGKSWKFENPAKHYVFTIEYSGGKIIRNAATSSMFNRILAFPTEEMRDAFYENFEKLINDCKELL